MSRAQVRVDSGMEADTRVGDKVRFAAADVFLPGQEAICDPLRGDAKLEGTVMDFSDSGIMPRVFAIVDVIRRLPMVVPVERLEIISESAPEDPFPSEKGI